MAVELLPPGAGPDDERWHELRRAGVTASEIAAVVSEKAWRATASSSVPTCDRPEPGKREDVPDEGSEGIRFPRSVPVPHYKNGGARDGLASQTQKSSVGLIGYLGLTSMAGSLVGFWQRLVLVIRKKPLRDKDVTASIEVKS